MKETDKLRSLASKVIDDIIGLRKLVDERGGKLSTAEALSGDYYKLLEEIFEKEIPLARVLEEGALQLEIIDPEIEDGNSWILIGAVYQYLRNLSGDKSGFKMNQVTVSGKLICSFSGKSEFEKIIAREAASFCDYFDKKGRSFSFRTASKNLDFSDKYGKQTTNDSASR